MQFFRNAYHNCSYFDLYLYFSCSSFVRQQASRCPLADAVSQHHTRPGHSAGHDEATDGAEYPQSEESRTHDRSQEPAGPGVDPCAERG